MSSSSFCEIIPRLACTQSDFHYQESAVDFVFLPIPIESGKDDLSENKYSMDIKYHSSPLKSFFSTELFERNIQSDLLMT